MFQGFSLQDLGRIYYLLSSEAPDFFPAGDMTPEVGQCLDVLHKILFLQMTGWLN